MDKEKVVDPVCGMEMEKNEVEATVKHLGKTYYFCSLQCRDEFNKDPVKYIKNI